MQREKMKKLLELNKSPLDISIEKWEDIVFNDGYDRGKENCALCELYRDETPEKPFCRNCDVFKSTGCIFCIETPYQEFTDHLIKCNFCYDYGDDYYYCEEAIKIAIKELEFLRGLKYE